jgi:RHS repeat-associated protein
LHTTGQPFAVLILIPSSCFAYDPNGNMTSRTIDGETYSLGYDAENRLNSVTQGDQTTTFTYDADGRRVMRETMTDTIVYVGSHYEALLEEQDIAEDLDGDCLITVVDIMLVASRWGMTEADPDWDPRYDLYADGKIDIADIMLVAVHWRETCERPTETVKYYTLGGKRVAMRREPVEQSDTLYYLFSDHLGSISVVYETISNTWVTQRYYPWGTIRPGPDNALPTDYTFTGQKLDESTELMYYGARYYDPALGRFVQADTIVPEPGNPQALNRYSYVLNNPLRYIDPTGHGHYVFLEEDLEVRITDDGTVQIVRGGSIFVNPVEVELANAILSGDQDRLLNAIPDGGLFFNHTLAAVLRELGYMDPGSGLGDLLMDPFLVAGLAWIVSDLAEDGISSISAGLPKLEFGQASVSSKFTSPEKSDFKYAGWTLEDVAAGLGSGKISPDELPIQFIERGGVRYAINNRSLKALRMAGMEPTVLIDITGHPYYEPELTRRLEEAARLGVDLNDISIRER